MNHNNSLGRQREQAIGALLSSRTIEEAAAKVGRHEKTLRRWLREPGFVDAYQQSKRELLRAGVGKLTSKVSLAVDVLAEIAEGPGREFQGARAHAAASIIKLALDAQLIDDVLARVERLERQGDDEWKYADENPRLN